MKVKKLHLLVLSFFLIVNSLQAQETLPDSLIERSLAEEDPAVDETDSLIRHTKILNNMLIHASFGYNYVRVKHIDAAPYKKYSPSVTNPLPEISSHNLNYGLSGLLNFNKFLVGFEAYTAKSKKTESRDNYSTCTGRHTNRSVFLNAGLAMRAKNFIFTPILGLGLYQSTLEYEFTTLNYKPSNDTIRDYLLSTLNINNKSLAMDLGCGINYLIKLKEKEVDDNKNKKSYEQTLIIKDSNTNVISVGLKIGFNAVLLTYDAYNSLNKIENKFASSGPYVKLTLGGGIFN